VGVAAPNNTNTNDIVIVGGGLVGLSLALILDEVCAGAFKISIIEKSSPKNNATSRNSHSQRTVALSHGTHTIFSACGLGSLLQPLLTPITRIHVSDKGHFGRAVMDAEQLAWPALGYVAYNDELQAQLLNEVGKRATISCQSDTSIKAISFHQDHVRYGLSDSNLNYSCRLLLVADGAGSPIAREVGISFEKYIYGQRAVVATVTTSEANQGCAFERFTDEGPIALLPLPGNQSSLVWTMSEQQFERRNDLADKEFIAQLHSRFGDRLGQIRSISERASFPLILSKATEQIRSHLVIMGNAAHNLHPVAGQSFNLSIRDSMNLALALKVAQENKLALGSLASLAPYAEAIRNDQSATIELSHQMVRLFSNDSLGLSVIRNIGLLALDNLSSVKTAFAKRSAGVSDGIQTGASV